MLPRGIECIAELITGIRNFVCSKHCTQATFVKTRVMRHKWYFTILNVRKIGMYFFQQSFPYFREEVGFICVKVALNHAPLGRTMHSSWALVSPENRTNQLFLRSLQRPHPQNKYCYAFRLRSQSLLLQNLSYPKCLSCIDELKCFFVSMCGMRFNEAKVVLFFEICKKQRSKLHKMGRTS